MVQEASVRCGCATFGTFLDKESFPHEHTPLPHYALAFPTQVHLDPLTCIGIWHKNDTPHLQLTSVSKLSTQPQSKSDLENWSNGEIDLDLGFL